MNKNKGISFPATRLRRTRRTNALRSLVEETSISTNDLIYPAFLLDGHNKSSPIKSMPGINRQSIEGILKTAEKMMDLGIPAMALFPVIKTSDKSLLAEEAFNSEGLIQRSIKKIKSEFPDLLIISDVALDPYTTHGQDGIIDIDNYVINDVTVDTLTKQALSHAEAGADIIAPSDMMDGRVGSIRNALELNDFPNTLILSYAVKYASSFYGPFRDAIGSDANLSTGNKYSYQMNPRNALESLREVALDINEGADIIMVKPAMPYLDIISRVQKEFSIPIFAYQVSGEYAMLKAAGNAGYLDYKMSTLESITAIKRAGASAILTYHALEIAEWLNE
ncbi:MAG: porphobilinogen synthase [Woeseiaceae bacterium]|jgi:porphobilinogen synthase|nr:porphobilinogen synthase [Woeseiaceae bacterium]MDG1865519.1 porphobilinogen synthase [Woeseiaceae bacterium]|tara:strand:- start:3726 stop:4733 length:1008 start_codon:yes stop_codon:yes gene_type:complete